MTQLTYTQVAAANFDAGLFRQFLAQRHGGTLTYGGMQGSMERAMRLVKQLARITGLSVAQVVADVQADYVAMED
jgi:hypothetical protein